MKAGVLFVDDDVNVLRGMRRMLRSHRDDWDMVFAASGEAALKECDNKTFNVVVTDMRMPGMDGAELLQIIRKRCPGIIRIILSGYSEEEAVLRTIGPAHRYLSKPCDYADLVESITSAINLHRYLADEKMRQLVSALGSLPSPPDVFLALQDELDSKASSVNSVAEILGRDVAMTAETLKLVNSAFFALPTKVTDLVQAVRLLGLDTIRAVSLIAGIYRKYSGDDRTSQSIWRLGNRSLGIGVVAKTIAIMDGLPPGDVQAAMCAGVLAHVGVLILLADFSERFERAMATVDAGVNSVIEAERQEFGASHPELGGYLLGLWGFSDTIVEAVAFHHEPSLYLGGSNRLVGVLHCAQVFAKCSGKESMIDDIVGQLDSAYLVAGGQFDRIPDWEKAAAEVLRRDTK